MSNSLSPSVAKALKNVRDLIQIAKQDVSNYTDIRNEVQSERSDDIENAQCEMSVDIEERLADIENALCELSEMEE